MRYICYQDIPKPLTCENPEVGAIAVTYLHGNSSLVEDCQLVKLRKKLKVEETDTIYFVNFFPEEMIRQFLKLDAVVYHSQGTVEEFPGIMSTLKEESFFVNLVELDGEELVQDDRTNGFDQLFYHRKAPEIIEACKRSHSKHKWTIEEGLNRYFNDGIDAVLKGMDFHGAIRAYADLIEIVQDENGFVPSIFVGAVGWMNQKR
ncbi:hypothetical protein [Moorena sp. SIO3B2]|uniref:hypothetical protein n=1 Tax=Moorena sp. SIO3B2 TaxID=2607827 RepID=UPI0013CB991A|nr:hypothetical protein [Moorena sp. SIO3B2]NEP31740.1 hypothetical protein [Moorena sp. SIO3B2]NEP31765.1 hypothetical protein [Moorena sp. SIO3B2]